MTPMSAYRLLLVIPEHDEADVDVEIAGRPWRVVSYPSLAAPLPEFVCISYSWGPGRRPHLFDSREEMPERTIPVVGAAVRAVDPRAIWIDALCVPLHGPERTVCLQSLGAIYRAATRVVVVLTGAVEVVIEEVVSSGLVSERALLALEADDWVSRAWTYQELVNARQVDFVSESGSGPVPATALFNAVGEAMAAFRRSRGLDQWELRAQHPRLDGLESLIADWSTADYVERSAFAVMGAMATRQAQHRDEVLYAMIGAITTDIAGDDERTLPAGEYFLRVCERKGDFSYVFSTGERSSPSWRPAGAYLNPVLAWPSSGSGQAGERIGGDTLQLRHMVPARAGRLGDAARRFLEGALPALGVEPGTTVEGAPAAILSHLQHAGFEGCGRHVELDLGYLFPMRPIPTGGDWAVAIARDVFWPFGAPALVVDQRADPAEVLDVGVFVGTRDAVTISLELG